MEKLKLTREQAMAVEARGNALLVSAAAGSGKTFVLVQRLLRQITDEEIHADITDFLIITYTKAAAAELRSKILKELNRRIAQEPGNRHLRRQAVLCLKANISTIHSFCTELLRENAHVMGISPEFRVADEAEASILRSQVLERLIEEKYEDIENNENFGALARLMSEARGDGKLTDAVLDAYGKLQSHVTPREWAENQKKNFDFIGVSDVGETPWGREILDEIYVICDYWHKKMQAAFEDMSVHPDMMNAYGESFSETIGGLENLKSALKKSWDTAYSCREVPFPRPKNVKGYEEFKSVRNKCKKAMEKAAARLDGTSAEMILDLNGTKRETLGFLELLMEFDAEYKKAKRQRGIIDFSDQEHMTAELLYDFKNRCPTLAAENVSQRYREILVDEYQDVNEVQELIFGAVSREGRNIFMVGDVKQSIYRFRMADPMIFLKKYDTYGDYGTGEENAPKKVILPMNFRSDRDILEAVNYTFKNLMSRQFGEMDYTDRECLNYGAGNPETDEEKVEYYILDLAEDESGAETGEAEAEFVAGRIREIVEGGTVIPDGAGGLRRAEYGDVAILLRSIKNRAWEYALWLDRLGIPVELPSDVDFFRCYEISLAVSFLAVIDNPRQDIPLIAVLRSPIYGFTENELAGIHVQDKKGGIYSALLKMREENEKCGSFLRELDYFRRAAGSLTTEKLLWLIYNKTGFMGIMAALEGGSEREENLIMFSEYARKFEANGYKGLFRFVSHIRTMMEREENITREDAAAGRGVRIMSIHKSKGLEFPIVFLADTAHKFNTSDTLKPALFHRELGIGLYKRDLERRIKYPTVARTAVSRRLTAEMMAEELRVLYVAMTRAKNKLIMVTSYRDAEKQIEKRAFDAEYPAQPAVLSSTASFGDWLLLTAMTRPEFSGIYKTERAFNPNAGTPWKMSLVKFKHISPVHAAEDKADEKVIDAGIKETILENLNYNYPHIGSHLIPSKVTATELKGRSLDPEINEDAAAISPTKKGSMRRPAFISGDRPLSGAERGTAVHTAMQYIDYNRCGTAEEIREELQRLVERNYLSSKQAEAVEPEKILGFFTSELGRRVLRCENIRREFKFSLLVPANLLFPGGAEDEVLFQGVVDCYIEEAGEISVIDFKSDYVNEKILAEKVAGYKNQVRLYAYALEKITGKKVKNIYLYFFSGGLTVEV